jgi:glycolate oxidase FAD binding subunit
MIRPNPFVASYGVGEVRAAVASDWIGPLREWAASHGGAVVIEDAPLAVREVVDPWGESPVMDLQRRVKSAFDPVGVMVPGRMPGGL